MSRAGGTDRAPGQSRQGGTGRHAGSCTVWRGRRVAPFPAERSISLCKIIDLFLRRKPCRLSPLNFHKAGNRRCVKSGAAVHDNGNLRKAVIKMGDARSSQSIEEIAAGLLDEDNRKSFLDFYDFLTSNKLGKRKTGRKPDSKNWAITYRNKKIAHFNWYKNVWSINIFDLFPQNNWFEKCEKYLTDELKDFILTNINTTSSCCVKGVCHSVEHKNIFGKTFSGRVCACAPIIFMNPEGKTLENAKKLILIGKNIIAEMAENK